ncbi:MAG: DMT family transporter, partial [Pseudomonadota bacterium]
MPTADQGARPPAAPRADRPTRAAALMVGSLCMLGLQDGLVKLASDDVSLWQFQSLRASINLALLLLVFAVMDGRLPPAPRSYRAVGLRSLFLVGAMICYFCAIPMLSLAEIAAGLYVFPLIVTLLSAIVLGEMVGPRRIAAVLVGFLGTLLILKPGTDSFLWVSLIPLGAAVCYAGTVLCTRRLCREEHPATLALGVAVAFLAVGLAGLGAMAAITPPELGASWPYLFTAWHPLELTTLGLVLACSCLNLTANIGLASAYQTAESSWLAPFDYSYLVFATAWGAVLFGHLPDALSVLGMGLIMGAGCFVAWRERQIARAAAAAAAAA